MKLNSEGEILNDESELTWSAYFTTAWGPPRAWLEACGLMFNMLTFTLVWEEEGGERGKIYGDGICEELPEREEDDE